jgi:hypothetical protein
LDIYDVSLEFLTQVVMDNPSLRGMLLGYIAERNLMEILVGHGRATAFRKDDDHDRKKKGDLVLTYKGFEFKVEVKSLQTNSVEMLGAESGPSAIDEKWVRKILKQRGRGQPNPAYEPIWEKNRLNTKYRGHFQCDASDRRKVDFPDGSSVETTNLLFGEFHVLAAGLFAFREKWDFGFALNRDLPASTNEAYTAYQRKMLITSIIPITWPLQTPFVSDIYALLDLLVEEEKTKGARKAVKEIKVVDAEPAKTVTEEQHLKVVEKKRRKKP